MRELTPGRELADPMAPYLAVDRSRRRNPCWVLGHMVAGLDGTAAIQGRVGALSTSPDRVLFRRMRQVGDVVLVGAETVRREEYGVVRLGSQAQEARVAEGRPPTPPIAVVSRSLELDWSAQVFTDAPEHARTMVVTCESADPGRRREAEQVADVVVAGADRVEPQRALAALAELGHRVVVCEGGPRWLGELTAVGCLDELCLTVAPMMGGDQLPVAVTPPGAGLSDFELRHVLVDSGTLFLRYELAGVPA